MYVIYTFWKILDDGEENLFFKVDGGNGATSPVIFLSLNINIEIKDLLISHDVWKMYPRSPQ